MFKRKNHAPTITHAFTISNSEKKKDNTYTVQLRLTQDRKPKYRNVVINSCKINVSKEQWDEKKQRIKKPRNTFEAEVNIELSKIEAKVLDCIKNSQCKVLDVFTKVFSTNISEDDNIFEIYERYKTLPNKNGEKKSEFTIEAYTSKIAVLKEFVGSDYFSINSITVEWLKKYETFLQNRRGNAPTSIHNHFKYLKAVYSTVIPRPLEKNVFNFYSCPRGKSTPKGYLKNQELSKFYNLKIDAERCPAQYKAKLLFDFLLHTNGMRISDALRIRFKSIADNRLSYYAGKNNKYFSLKMNKDLEEILNLLGWPEKDEGFIFDYLPENFFTLDDYSQMQLLKRNDAAINSALKKVALKAGIDKNITTHLARHTVANILVRKNVPVNRIGGVLGHSSEKITRNYIAEWNDGELDEYTENLIEVPKTRNAA